MKHFRPQGGRGLRSPCILRLSSVGNMRRSSQPPLRTPPLTPSVVYKMQGPGPRGSAAVRFRRLRRGFYAEPLAGIMASPTCGTHRYELNKAGFMATGFGSGKPAPPL